MKTKLLAIVLSMLMLVQPVMAIGMVGMESANEVAEAVEIIETTEEANLSGESNVPQNAVVFDDFESYNAGDAIPASFSTVYNTTGLTNALKITADGTMSIAEFGGSKVIKNTKTIGQYYNIGFKLNNIPTVNVGKYELTFDAYLVYDGTNAWDQLVTTNITGNNNYYLSGLGDNKNNKWNTYKLTFDVTESGGTKTCVVTYCNGSTKTIDVTGKEHLGLEAHMYFTNKGVGTTQTYYLDNVALTYKAPYVPANVPAGAILYEDFGGADATSYNAEAVKYTKNFSYAAADYASVTMSTYSTMIYKYVNFSGNMVLAEKPAADYRIGLGFTGAALSDGDYVYTVKMYPVTTVPKSFTMRFQGGTQTDINLSNIGATLVAGDWNTLKYPFTIYTEEGTRKIKICNTSATTFTGTLSVQNFGTQSAYTHEFYFDDISLVKVIPATVTYLDESGATLGTISTTVGETFTVGNGISVAYTPVYTINGEKVNAGDVVTVTGDMTVNVAKYVPENIPANAIVYEDFEGYAEGAAVFENGMAYDVSTPATKMSLTNFYANAASSVATSLSDNSIAAVAAKGGKAFKISNRANDYKIFSFKFANLPAKEVGQYNLSFKIFAEDNGTYANAIYLHYNNAGSANAQTTPTLGEWQTISIPYEIKMVDGVKTCICNGFGGSNLTFAINGDNLYSTEIRYISTDVTVADKHAMYLDDICLTYKAPATITYIGEGNTTLKTISTTVGETATIESAEALGLEYLPVYTINGETVSAGDTLTLTGDVTVNVAKYVPANIPANAIFFEDFDYYAEYADTATRFSNYGAYTSGQAAGAKLYETYNKSSSTQSIVTANGSKVFKQSDCEEYSAGFEIGGIKLEEPGTYTLSFKYLATLPEESTATKPQFFFRFMNTGTALISDEWSRVYVTDLSGEEWKTYSKSFEIYYEDGAKKIKSGNYSAALPATGITALAGFYIPNGNHIGVTYYDDICLTYKAPATVTYVDELGTTLKTVNAFVGDTVAVATVVELGVNYKAIYTISGENVKEGDQITLSGNVTVNVAKYVPANIPENAIFFEEFESFDVYEDTTTRFNETGAYTAGQAAGAKVYETYDKGTQSIVTMNGTKALKQTDSADYSAGIQISGLAISEPGTYTLSYKYIADLQDGSDVVKTQFFFRFNNTGTVLIGDDWSREYITEFDKTEWTTYSKTFEIYYEDGAKKIKSGSYVGTLPASGITAICGLYVPTSGDYRTTTYYDDICITYEYVAPAIVDAYFMPQNGDEPFAYTVHSENGSIKLPTAAQLGIDYTPCYKYDSAVYYPGQSLNFDSDAEIELVVANTATIFVANGGETPDFATGEAKDAVIGGTVKDGAYECNYSDWGANIIADGLKLGAYGTYSFDFDVTVKDEVSFAVHTMLYNSTSDGDEVTSIAGTTVKNGTTHISHSVEIYEKDGAPYFKDRTGAEHPLDKFGYFPIARAVAMGTDKSGKFYVDNYTISFIPYAPTLVNKASYRVEDEHGKGGPAGIRFAAYVTDEQRDACVEYGFVVTRKAYIGEDYAKLNLDGVTVAANGVTSSQNSDGILVVAAAAYNGSVSKIYTHDGSTFGNEYMGIQETFFTGVLTGIPNGMEADVFVGRPYIKIDGNIYYGDCIERCYNDFHAAQNA